MKLACVVVAAACLAASPVKAQVVDLSTITCADFSARPADQMANIMFWLEGYYTEDDDPTTIDFAEFHAGEAPRLLLEQSHGRGADRCRRSDGWRQRQLSLPAHLRISGFSGCWRPWQGARLA
jgi:hypothetical protein